MNLEGGTFLQEAQKRVPEKIIINDLKGERFVEENKRENSILLSLARSLNPNFQLGEKEVKPILFYGTVDPVGNVSELLTMMKMSQKLKTPMVLTLDDIAHGLISCNKRITDPSNFLAGIKSERQKTDLRFDQVMGMSVLPREMNDFLEEIGISTASSLSQIYEEGLYLLAYEFFGDEAFKNLAILRSSVIFGPNEPLGKMKIGFLRKKVSEVARNLGKESLVFLHFNGQIKRSGDSELDDISIAELYEQSGYLGGNSWVSLTALLLDKNIFEQTHPLVLAEKDTSLGANFAAVYEKLLNGNVESNRVAVTGVRRIKASRFQEGGNGIDPLVLLYLIKNRKDGEIYKEVIEKHISDAFPQGAAREKEIVLEQAVINSAKLAKLKETKRIDGNTLIDMGVEKPKIGKALLALADAMLADGLRGDEEVIEIIKSI